MRRALDVWTLDALVNNAAISPRDPTTNKKTQKKAKQTLHPPLPPPPHNTLFRVPASLFWCFFPPILILPIKALRFSSHFFRSRPAGAPAVAPNRNARRSPSSTLPSICGGASPSAVHLSPHRLSTLKAGAWARYAEMVADSAAASRVHAISPGKSIPLFSRRAPSDRRAYPDAPVARRRKSPVDLFLSTDVIRLRQRAEC